MKRRSFLAACGLFGLVVPSNLKALVLGPKLTDMPTPGGVFYQQMWGYPKFGETFVRACTGGERIRAGDAVYYGTNGKLYRSSRGDKN